MKIVNRKWIFISLLLCSCGEIISSPKKETTHEKATPAALPHSQLNLTISQQTQQACSASNVTLQRGHLDTLKQTIKNLITQAGSTESQKPWKCAISLADDMQSHLQKQPAPRKATWYDVVVIGAGVQASIFNASLWQKIDKQKIDPAVLFVDQNPDGGAQHFRTYIYPINTGAKGTNFPPAPLQINEYTPEDSPPAYSIWTQTTFSHVLSRSHFVFGKRVQSIEFVQDSTNNHQYKVHIDDMPVVHTGAVVVATGLGEPKFPEESDFMWLAQQHKQATTCQKLSCVPAVLTFEDMVLLERQLNIYNHSLLTALKGKQVAILGNSASGQAARDFLEGKAPARAYEHASTHTRPSHIQQFPGGSDKVLRLGSAQGKGVILWDSKNNKHIFDVAIVAMGYDRKSRIKQLIQKLTEQAQANQEQTEPLTFVAVQDDKNTPMAYQLKEKCQLVGDKMQCPFAGDRDADEPETKTGHKSPFHQIFIVGSAAEAIGQGKSLGDVISTAGGKTTQFAHWLAPQLVKDVKSF